MSDASRLDAFTDAAFAFAVSLMVVGAGGVAPDYAGLLLVMQSVPSFAIGFAIISMFWFAHVRWRTMRRGGDRRSVVLTFLLVFSVLVYVHPLRAMSASFASFLSGQPDSYGGHVPDMFRIYGIGFTVMAGIVAALFSDVLRDVDLNATQRHDARGEVFIWLILATTGAVSTAMTLIPVLAMFAPVAYATIPITIMLFASSWTRRAPAA